MGESDGRKIKKKKQERNRGEKYLLSAGLALGTLSDWGEHKVTGANWVGIFAKLRVMHPRQIRLPRSKIRSTGEGLGSAYSQSPLLA